MFDENYIYVLREKSCVLQTDKSNEYELKFSVFNNNTINITICSTKQIISKNKFVLKCSMEELKKNRFFKLFINVEEVFRELETRLEKSNIIEETNAIFLDIPIGLNVINDVILEIKQIEKSNEDINEELKKNLNQKIDESKIKLNLIS